MNLANSVMWNYYLAYYSTVPARKAAQASDFNR